MGKQEQVEQWRYQCCRSHHYIEITRRGNIAIMRDQKRSHHGNVTTRSKRIGPTNGKARKSIDLVAWWHAQSCPNKGWCEYYRQEQFRPRQLKEVIDWNPTPLDWENMREAAEARMTYL